MQTAQALNAAFNKAFKRPPGNGPKILGPATAGDDPTADLKHPERTFTYKVIMGLTGNGSKPIRAPDFGWSHHNYEDVVNIAITIYRLSRPPSPFTEQQLEQLAPIFYGQGTQGVRDILYGPVSGPLWFGWGGPDASANSPSRGLFDTDPFIFLTEGGAPLDGMANAIPLPFPDPNGTSNPEAVELKGLQKYAVGGAADTLQGGTGRGVEMFTNFLFFDNLQGDFSGLCDQYGPAKKRSAPNETAGQYERPVYATWKKFGL